MKTLLVLILRAYQALISPALAAIFSPTGLGCRFEPSCSQYAVEALQTHGCLGGIRLTARRLCRCHPWGGYGYDPVPKLGRPLGSSYSAGSSSTPMREASPHSSTS